jgi:hypothetical protein
MKRVSLQTSSLETKTVITIILSTIETNFVMENSLKKIQSIALRIRSSNRMFWRKLSLGRKPESMNFHGNLKEKHIFRAKFLASEIFFFSFPSSFKLVNSSKML